MDSKKFLIVRIVIIVLSVISLISIEYYQRKIIKDEEKVINVKNKIDNEDYIVDMAKIYVTNRQDYFNEVLNEEDLEYRISIKDLINDKLLDDSYDSNGYVSIVNNKFNYVKTSELLSDKINYKDFFDGINNEDNAYDLKYIYVGENPNNYLLYNDVLYRIIGITNSNELKVIEMDTSVLDKWGLSGDINYLKSSDKLEKEGNKGIFYVGYIRSSSKDINKIMKNEKRNNTYTVGNPKFYGYYSYVNISDIINAADDCDFSKVTSINEENCSSYLLSMLSNTFTSNTLENNLVYKISEKNEVISSKIDKDIFVKKVRYISLYNEYVKGNGTSDDPYEIK